MRIIAITILLSLATQFHLVLAQDTIRKETAKERKARKVKEGRMMITPLAGPAYTPELGLLVAGCALITFKTDRQDSLIQRSSINTSLGYTSTGAVVGNALFNTFWFKDKLRITGALWYKDMPDNYWGKGYTANSETVKSDTTTAYDRLWWQINPRFLYQFKKHFFVGYAVDINKTNASNVNPVMAADSYYSKFGPDNFNSGMGLTLMYDSRDIPVNAWKGSFADITFMTYGKGIGSDNNYQTLNIDLRTYQQLSKPGCILAVQLKSRLGFGEVPWGELSMLGTPFDLRGYTWGRYRDKSNFFLLTEYRHKFYKQNGEISKSGVVFWFGSGTEWDSNVPSEDLSFIPNFGVGYRIEVQPRMNLRVDYGIGKETSGFYFNFTEAF